MTAVSVKKFMKTNNKWLHLLLVSGNLHPNHDYFIFIHVAYHVIAWQPQWNSDHTATVTKSCFEKEVVDLSLHLF